jgi:AraC-like DNA-binding protein
MDRIPFYRDINAFLASLSPELRTPNPDFYCLRIRQGDSGLVTYKPPFRKDFYFMGLVTSAGATTIGYDGTSITSLNSFMVFQSPGLTYSFQRDPRASGFLIYFKPALFDFFKPGLETAFPFFTLLNTNFFRINHEVYLQWAPLWEQVFTEFEQAGRSGYGAAAVSLLYLLHKLNAFASAHAEWEQGFTSQSQQLVKRFQQLIQAYYLEVRTVEAYAGMLHVTPNHLSQTVKEITGKNALQFIQDRLLAEAKSLIRYTSLDIAEIAYQLQFSDPGHFGKFFKRETGITPAAFRNSGMDS